MNFTKKIFSFLFGSGFFLLLASLIYDLFTSLRNFLYEKNIFSSINFEIPVISVGNLTLGGTGKTPLVAWLAQWLAQHNKKPAIISRGYKAEKGQLSDEAAELDTVHWQIHPLPPNAQLHLVLAEDHLKTQVRRGENSGRQLHHDGVVRNMQTIKLINTQGKAMITIPQDAKRGHCRIIGLLQDQNSMRIMAGKQLTLRPIHE